MILDNIKTIRTTDNIYTNIYLLFPIYQENYFHALLAVKDKEIIADINCHISDISRYDDAYERKNKIFERLIKSYEILCNDIETISIDEHVCLFMTPFDSVNFGHNLSMIFHYIHLYRYYNLKCPIVISEISLKYPNAYKILQLFFDNIIIIKNDIKYKFSKVHIFPSFIFHILLHKYLIKECINKSIEKSIEKNIKKQNIILIKTTKCNNLHNPHSAFIADKFYEVLQEKGWIIINPEIMCIYDIICYLQNANKIVTGFGSISYGHAIFFSDKAKLFYLQINNDNPYWEKEKYTIINCGKNLDNKLSMILNLLEA
jgi:hypothetical protein